MKMMVDGIRIAEVAVGTVSYGPCEHEKDNVAFQRSLFIVKDVQTGDVLDESNVRIIRPADGLAPKHLDNVLGRRATRDAEQGTPVDWSLVA